MANNKRFTTFKAFKRWLWHNLRTGETLEGFQIWEDTIFKRYNIKKTERRLLIEITYDLEKSQKEYFKNLQLNLFDNENQRDAMGRNYPSYFDRNNCNHYYALCAKLHDEFKRQQKQSKLNAKN